MLVCAFFGHRDAGETIKPLLRKTIIKLIEEYDVGLFYVGNQGAFDRMVKEILNSLKEQFFHIRCAVVYAYYPTSKQQEEEENETVYPEGLECVFKKYAIIYRNEWMLSKADYVITHVTHPSSGAARFKAMAERKGKTVINVV